MPLWQRLIIVACVVLASVVLAKLVDLRMARKQLGAAAATRYRVLRRSVTISIVFVALMSSLLVIPQVRAVAGGILASSAVVGLIIGFASQRTLANFAAGILIAFTQPVRLGDRIAIEGVEGVVEEIGLTYTFIRTDDDARLVVPNEKLASDTIRNATIVDRSLLAEITVQVPLNSDLDSVLELLHSEVADERGGAVFVSGLNGSATLTVRALTADASTAELLEHDLRRRVHARLRDGGIFA
jgi:small-conductance mechanosensitive channel